MTLPQPIADAYVTRIRDALLHDWDPIGVAAFPQASDEYDGYVNELFALLVRGATQEEIFKYLWELETGHIGLTGSEERRQHTEAFSRKMLSFSEGMARDCT